MKVAYANLWSGEGQRVMLNFLMLITLSFSDGMLSFPDGMLSNLSTDLENKNCLRKMCATMNKVKPHTEY